MGFELTTEENEREELPPVPEGDEEEEEIPTSVPVDDKPRCLR